MNRKCFLKTVIVGPLMLTLRLKAESPEVAVFKDPTCECCGKWVEHLRANGFEVTVHEVSNTAEYRRKYDVPEPLASCHTAVVDGYAIEGHVPATDIQRLLRDRPKAKGLAVPGMPVGSPGMDGPRHHAYSVVMFDSAGRTSVFQRYPAL